MKTELKGLMGIDAIMTSQDVAKLLKNTQSICTKGGGRMHDVMTVVQAKKPSKPTMIMPRKCCLL